jgi:hypothetical protein
MTLSMTKAAAGLVLGVAMALPAAAAGETTTCKLGSQARTLGPSYVTSLKVGGTTCRSGKRLVRAYYRCRVANGGLDGRCRSIVRGYACTEKRTGISIQFDAKVSCRKGSARVVHTYTQNT